LFSNFTKKYLDSKSSISNSTFAQPCEETFIEPPFKSLFADRISYVISSDGKIASAIKDSGAHRHIENALGVVKNLQKSPSPN
jgi:hypothetical protein